MNSSPCRWIDFDTRWLEGSGVARHSIITISEVDRNARAIYADWLATGHHGEMTYLERYDDVRANPALLLEDAQSMICCAIPYYWPLDSDRRPPLSISRYALGRDYHDVVAARLKTVASRMSESLGCQTRVCVDTAPLRERYWAARSGLGTIGRNNQLIIPGLGSYFFIGEILTTARLKPTVNDDTAESSGFPLCNGCDRCQRACPTGALKNDGSCDASRCLSYLTIEHRGDLPEGTDLHGTFYGCDRCAAVCPHNATPLPTDIEEFRPNPSLLTMTAADVLALTPETFAETFRGSAMKRAKLAGLRRNALHLNKQSR